MKIYSKLKKYIQKYENPFIHMKFYSKLKKYIETYKILSKVVKPTNNIFCFFHFLNKIKN